MSEFTEGCKRFERKWLKPSRASRRAAPPCSPPPYELACRMLNAIGWNGNDFRLRDPVALAIAPEVERINRTANAEVSDGGPLTHESKQARTRRSLH